jgi:hypothetical protein
VAAISGLPLFATETWFGPTGYIEVPEALTAAEAEMVRAAWAEASKDPEKPAVLSGGARFVPFGAYEPQAILSETLEAPDDSIFQAIKWLAIGNIATALGVIAVAATVLLR